MDKTDEKLLNLVSFFHGYYARSKDPEALEIAKNIGIALKDTKGKEWLKREKDVLGYNLH